MCQCQGEHQSEIERPHRVCKGQEQSYMEMAIPENIGNTRKHWGTLHGDSQDFL